MYVCVVYFRQWKLVHTAKAILDLRARLVSYYVFFSTFTCYALVCFSSHEVILVPLEVSLPFVKLI